MNCQLITNELTLIHKVTAGCKLTEMQLVRNTVYTYITTSTYMTLSTYRRAESTNYSK